MKFGKFLMLSVSILLIGFMCGCAASSNAGGDAAKSAKKVKEKPYDPTGSWEYTVATPNGDSFGVMTVTGGNGLFEASLATDQFGTLQVSGFTVVGTSFSGTIDVMGTMADLSGNFDGDTMTGSVLLGADSYPMEGSRKTQ
jgi:hypothetical protein